MLRQPIRVATEELSKLIPGLGQIVAPSISVAMIEAAGWIPGRGARGQSQGQGLRGARHRLNVSLGAAPDRCRCRG